MEKSEKALIKQTQAINLSRSVQTMTERGERQMEISSCLQSKLFFSNEHVTIHLISNPTSLSISFQIMISIRQ